LILAALSIKINFNTKSNQSGPINRFPCMHELFQSRYFGSGKLGIEARITLGRIRKLGAHYIATHILWEQYTMAVHEIAIAALEKTAGASSNQGHINQWMITDGQAAAVPKSLFQAESSIRLTNHRRSCRVAYHVNNSSTHVQCLS